jgi:BlaI family penicillinase repressor
MQLSDAEWKIMGCLWRRQQATAREIVDDLQDETAWAYTTVKTMLTRMVEKGTVRETHEVHGPHGGRGAQYQPLITREQARHSALRGLVDRAFGGALAPLMQHLLDEEHLSAGDRARLRELLDAPKARPGRRRKPGRSETVS